MAKEIKKNVQGEAQDIKLVDVIDLKFLQEFQDDFAKGMGLASVTVDVDGNPVTNPSYYTRFAISIRIRRNAATNAVPNRTARAAKKRRVLANRLYTNVMPG